ncbi:MAG: hypothetical protein LBH81_02665 [Rickettsiales bacterium]|nr:hypothetical protein [Rickettsiales bacterium]
MRFSAVLLSGMVCFCLVRAADAADAATSADFADAWNGGDGSITVVGTAIDSKGDYGIILANALNPFSGPALSINSYGGTPDGTALIMGGYTLAFAPGWNNDISASISNLTVYGAANGAVAFAGNGIGNHNFTVAGTYFYNNSSSANGAAVSVNSQMQSGGDNSYVLTDNDFANNAAASGGAVYMASNNSQNGGGTFAVVDDTGTNGHYLAMNRASQNGGAIYFMGNNAGGAGVSNDFSAQGYTYYQNYAAGMGGAVYNGVLNGNAPAANNFDIAGGVFTQNQAAFGGAVATEINGGNTAVNVNLVGSFYSNVAAQGGAIYNAVGDQYSPYGGNITFDISGPFDSNKSAGFGGAIYNNIQAGQADIVVNISGSFTNNYASGGGGAIYNTSGNNYPGTSVVNIADGTLFDANGALFGGAIYNSGNGVINLNTGASGINFLNNYAAGFANGPGIYQDSATAAINITGGGTVNINDGIAGIGTINQESGTTLNLNAASQSTGFAGVFNNAAGAVVNVQGLMFGGQNNIGGTANVSSSQDTFYFNADMLSDSAMNFTAVSSNRISISRAAAIADAGINFMGSGATVGFNAGMPGGALYNLQNDISNGQSNSIGFNNSGVILGSADYTGGTAYGFYNGSLIDLANSSANYQQYNFLNLGADATASLSFKIGNNQGGLSADSLNVANGGGTINYLGKIYVNDADGLITGTMRIIYGDVLDFQNGLSQFVATSNGTYTITTVNNQYVQLDSVPSGGGGSGSSSSAVDSGGGTTTTTNNPGGGTTTTTTDPSGGATTTTTNPDGSTTTTTTNPDGSSASTTDDGAGNTITVVTDPDGNSTITSEPGGTVVDVPAGGSGSASLPDGTTVDVGPDGNGGTTTTIVPPSGGGTTINTNPGGDTTINTTDPNGGGSTTTTTDPNGGGSSTTDPNGGTASTTTNPGGTSTGMISVPNNPSSLVLVLNDVNELDSNAAAAGMSDAVARSWQIGAAEIYQNDGDLGVMADGTFSVHGAVAGTRTAVLSGLNSTDGETGQSLFDIENDDTYFTLQDLTVRDALDSSGRGGAVIYMDNASSSATLSNLALQNNSSTGNGGAANIAAGSTTSTNLDYTNNSAGGDGGAIYNTGTINKHGGSFVGNSAGGNGGAIYHDSSSSSETTAIYSGDHDMNFTGNTAGGLGGAIYNAAGSQLDISVAQGANMIFSGNADSTGANDIYNAGTITLISTGGILFFGSGIAGTAGALIAKHSPADFILAESADNSNYLGEFLQTNGIVDAYGMFFGGTNNIQSGILNWHLNADKLDSAVMNITGGTVNIYGGLKLNPGDIIGESATINLYSTGFLDIAGGAIWLNPTDSMPASSGGTFGKVNQSDGYIVARGAGLAVYSDVLQKTGGVTVIGNNAVAYVKGLAPSGGLTGGDLVLSDSTLFINNVALNVGAGGGTYIATSGALVMGDNALVNSMDGAIQTHNFAGKFAIFSVLDNPVNSIAKFSVDLDARNARSDQFVFSGTAAPGELIVNGDPASGIADIYAMDAVVMLDEINLLNSPRSAVVPFNIMSSPNYDPAIMFAASADSIMTPAGEYSLVSLGSGNYELRLQGGNPQALRGGVSTNAMMLSQGLVAGVMFDHVFLDSDECLMCKYAPWQFQEHQKGVWVKAYGGAEKLKLGGGLDEADSNLYGIIAGLDTASVLIGGEKSWRWVPTLYMAYNGGKQRWSGVEMTQNGGQIGIQSTWTNGKFIGALMAYNGFYNTEIDVGGAKDSVDNWFVGAAGKIAYDMRVMRYTIVQPNFMASYNHFGGREWMSNYGDIEMYSSYVDGANVAPGLALIFGMESVNVFLSGLYNWNLSGDSKNRIGEMEQPKLGMVGSYFEYGFGMVGSVRESLTLDAKFSLRSSDEINGFNARAGISYRF